MEGEIPHIDVRSVQRNDAFLKQLFSSFLSIAQLACYEDVHYSERHC